MIIFPRLNLIINDLNSYYVDLPKLLEHYQGLLNSGCIYFKSISSESIIYFDDENIINGVLIEKNKIIKEQLAINNLIESFNTKNYSISIYEISQDFVTFWANIYDSIIIKKIVLNNFKDLEVLFKKYSIEKLTGSLEIKNQSNILFIFFFLNGNMFLSSSSEDNWQLLDYKIILDKLKESCFLDINNTKLIINVKTTSLKQRYFLTNFENVNTNILNVIKRAPVEPPLKFIELLQNLMILFEKYFNNNKKNKEFFDKLLKKKFIEKVDKFVFLDPFSAEFAYIDGKITFTGSENHQNLANSVIECLNEISNENNMKLWLKKHIAPLEEKYSNEFKKLENKISYN
ncbi:MAG: hypothetical protein WC799_11325 [Desulfobacteraceae bacterium]|jgi:hypothetical protein